MNAASQITSQITASHITAAASRKPRKLQAPSQRDQQIYIDYQTSGMRQSDLAKKYELTQCRISQIIRRVERWLNAIADEAGTGAGVPGFERSSNPVDGSEESATDDTAARQQLQIRLEYERLNSVCRLAMQHFQQQQKSITHKKGSRAGKPIDETTERLLPSNLQCLKVVLHANSQLSRLEKKRATGVLAARDRANDDGSIAAQQTAAQQTADQQSGDIGRAHVEDWLTSQRDDVERAGLAPCSFGSRPLIRDLVNTLLGQPNKGVALCMLAQECGKKVVDRKSYDDHPPKLPPDAEGWYYPMYDYHGGLVAWLSADQFAGAVHPDYHPVRAADPDAANLANPESAADTSSTTSPADPDPSQLSPGAVLTTPELVQPFDEIGFRS